jgi:hypothetical protein
LIRFDIIRPIYYYKVINQLLKMVKVRVTFVKIADAELYRISQY